MFTVIDGQGQMTTALYDSTPTAQKNNIFRYSE